MGEAVRVMISPEELGSVALFVERCASELASPHDQRVLEKAASLEVDDQGSERSIRFATLLGQLVHQVVAWVRAMVVPTPVVQLNEADAGFDETSGE